MKPSLSQSSPTGFPVWCYCSPAACRRGCLRGTTARSGQAPETTDGAPMGFLGGNIRECRLDSVQHCRSDGDSARPPSERPINRRTRLKGDASVSLAHLGQFGGRCRAGGGVLQDRQAPPVATPNGARQAAPTDDKRVVTFLFSETSRPPQYHRCTRPLGAFMHALRDQGPITTLNSTQVETYRGCAGANQGRAQEHRPPSRPAGGAGWDSISSMVGRASRLVVGPVNIWACRASITVPGPADLPFRSCEASYQPAPSLGSQL